METELEKKIKAAERDEFGRPLDRGHLKELYAKVRGHGPGSLTPIELEEWQLDRAARFTSFEGEYTLRLRDDTVWQSGAWPEVREERRGITDRNSVSSSE